MLNIFSSYDFQVQIIIYQIQYITEVDFDRKLLLVISECILIPIKTIAYTVRPIRKFII